MTTQLTQEQWTQKAYEILLERHEMKEGESDPGECENIRHWAISLWMNYDECSPEEAVNEELSYA